MVNCFSDPTCITRDNFLIKSMIDDRISTNYIGLKFARDLSIALSLNNQILPKFRHPVLILHGQNDQLLPFETSKGLYQMISSPDKQIKLYEDLYHELYLDLGKETVLRDMVQWLHAKAPGAGTLGYVPTFKFGLKIGGKSSLRQVEVVWKLFLVVVYLVILRHLNRIPAYRKSRLKLLFFPIFWVFKYFKFLTLNSISWVESFINQILVEISVN